MPPVLIMILLAGGLLAMSSRKRPSSPADVPGVPTTAPPGTDLAQEVAVVSSVRDDRLRESNPEYKITDMQVLKTATGYKLVVTRKFKGGSRHVETTLYDMAGKQIPGSYETVYDS